MADESPRDTWKRAKAEATKVFDVSKIADKKHLGPKLDKYDAELKAYRKLSLQLEVKPNATKEAAAREKVKDAGDAVVDAAQTYLKALELVVKGNEGPVQQAAQRLSRTLSMNVITPIKKQFRVELGGSRT